jgi:hypothetical protein
MNKRVERYRKAINLVLSVVVINTISSALLLSKCSPYKPSSAYLLRGKSMQLVGWWRNQSAPIRRSANIGWLRHRFLYANTDWFFLKPFKIIFFTSLMPWLILSHYTDDANPRPLFKHMSSLPFISEPNLQESPLMSCLDCILHFGDAYNS